MKTYRRVVSLIVFTAFIGGCALAPSSGRGGTKPKAFSMEVKVAKKVYKPGELIVVDVWASEDCYLSLYDISTQGEVTQIFPNSYAADNLIQGRRIYPIPAKSDAFDFEVSGPAGLEKVRGVCTKANVNFFEEQTRNSSDLFPSVADDSDRFERAINTRLNAVPDTQWAEAEVSFQVR
ncbi:hypothetical protein CSB45_15125 [candidate division KSB3 bacterium]|uniref:DUF4384 domain-containing protein n=1 Tax=candidate division KSB3 bacterium TaxID=2044937 RepID=A0A2G6E0M8_9BACT|nr:MAG: hypothetical protein CSB45_15125 [candidate division KSB3 bacterium]PIE28330.1 MAG: hypothetical protein CSA57_14420 [candidate division KSB3 bacterium]